MARNLDSPGGAKAAAEQLLNAGPYALQSLARIFKEQRVKVLMSAWASVLVDAISEARPSAPLAPVARALNCVVTKLGHRPAPIARKSKSRAAPCSSSATTSKHGD